MWSLAVMLAASTLLLNPPARVVWATAEVHFNAQAEPGTEICEVREVRVLATTVLQAATDGMSADELSEFDELLDRISADYETLDRKGQIALRRQYLTMSQDRTRLIHSAWVLLDTTMVSYQYIYDSITSSWILKLEDEVTGEYVSILNQKKDKKGSSELIRQLLERESKGEDVAEQYRKVVASEKERVVRLDVNGAVVFVDQESPEFEKTLESALPELWGGLPSGEGKARIEKAIPILWKVSTDSGSVFSEVGMKWPIRPSQMTYDTCFVEAGMHFEHEQQGGGISSFEGPSQEVVELFFAKKKLPLPDARDSFEVVARNIL